MEIKDMKFFKLFSHFGTWNILKSKDFIFSFFFGFLLSTICLQYCSLPEIILSLTPIFIGVAGAMITVAIAGLAIIVALSDENFISILKKAKIYNDLLFLFYYSTVISALSITVSIFSRVSVFATRNEFTHYLLLTTSVILVLYSVSSVVLLVAVTMQFGFYRGKFIDLKNKNRK